MPMLKDPRWSAINFDGTPAAGAKMYIYEAGTDIIVPVFANSSLNTNERLENPMIADGYGYFAVPYLNSGSYKVRIEDRRGVLIGQVDGVVVE